MTNNNTNTTYTSTNVVPTNNLTFIGRLGADPEMMMGTKDGQPYNLAKFSLAVDHYDRSKKTTITTWYRVTVWNGQADYVTGSIKLRKGDMIAITADELTIDLPIGGDRVFLELRGISKIDLVKRAFNNRADQQQVEPTGDIPF